MKKPIVFMFSGQGSQYYQMGKELFDQHPVFRKWMLKIDTMVYQITGKSIVDEIYDDSKRKSEKFDRTLYTYPAIFMVEYSLAMVFLECGIKPDYVIGASMGEFCPAAIANVMKIEDVVEALMNQAMALEASCQNGGMIAVLQSTDFYYNNPMLFENSELISINYHSHFVISGDTDKLAKVESFLKSSNTIYQALPVQFGFHSRSIDAAEKTITDFLRTKTFNKPIVPYVSCLYGHQVSQIEENYFWEVIRKPILFQKAIQEMERIQGCTYLDLGPSGTLTNFAKHNLASNSASTCHSIMTPFGRDCKNLGSIGDLLGKKIV